ncbi:MAG: DUF6685 family protein [Aeromonas veronii]
MLKGYQLNSAAINAFTEQFELFAITRDPLLWDELFEAMRALQATWYAGDLPRPHNEGRVLLPKADRRSMTVASALRQAGMPDLGYYLQRQVHRQDGLSGRADHGRLPRLTPHGGQLPRPQRTSPCWTACGTAVVHRANTSALNCSGCNTTHKTSTA